MSVVAGSNHVVGPSKHTYHYALLHWQMTMARLCYVGSVPVVQTWLPTACNAHPILHFDTWHLLLYVGLVATAKDTNQTNVHCVPTFTVLQPLPSPPCRNIGGIIPEAVRPKVTLGFCSLPRATDLAMSWAEGGRSPLLEQFTRVVRVTLAAMGGYECQEKRGSFMLTFPCMRVALEWSLLLQLALLQVCT
jgi:hypothetical protein